MSEDYILKSVSFSRTTSFYFLLLYVKETQILLFKKISQGVGA